MGITDFIHKQTPHLTPVLILGGCSFFGPFLGIFSTGMHNLATTKDIPNLWLETLSIVGHSGEVGTLGLFAFMSQAYGRFIKAKEDEKVSSSSNDNDNQKGYVPPPEIKGK